MARELQLSQGLIALVDDEDYKRLAAHKWSADRRNRIVYAVRCLPASEDGKRRKVYLHHEVLKPVPGMVIDHVNGNGLDCRKDNLRTASVRHNAANRNGFEFIGVSWHKRAGKWRARIKVNYKEVHLGLFDTKEEAATAYNEAAVKHNGEFAAMSTNLDAALGGVE